MKINTRPANLPARVFVLVAFAFIMGSAANTLRTDDRGIPWRDTWSNHVETRAQREGLELVNTEQAHRIVEEGTHVVFDARSGTAYLEGYIPGSISLPYADIDTAFLEAQIFITPQQPILTYCSDHTCDDALLLSLFLLDHGYTNIVLYAGGMKEWTEAGHPIEGAQ